MRISVCFYSYLVLQTYFLELHSFFSLLPYYFHLASSVSKMYVNMCYIICFIPVFKNLFWISVHKQWAFSHHHYPISQVLVLASEILKFIDFHRMKMYEIVQIYHNCWCGCCVELWKVFISVFQISTYNPKQCKNGRGSLYPVGKIVS